MVRVRRRLDHRILVVLYVPLAWASGYDSF